MDDLLQDALVRAARAPSFPPPERRDAWFFRLLRNALADAHRAAARAPGPLDDEVAPPPLLRADLDGAREGDLPELCQCDYGLGSRLTPAQRELVTRVHLEGEPVGAVAADLGLRPGAAYTALHRARAQLREEITDRCGATDAAAALAAACEPDACAPARG